MISVSIIFEIRGDVHVDFELIWAHVPLNSEMEKGKSGRTMYAAVEVGGPKFPSLICLNTFFLNPMTPRGLLRYERLFQRYYHLFIFQIPQTSSF